MSVHSDRSSVQAVPTIPPKNISSSLSPQTVDPPPEQQHQGFEATWATPPPAWSTVSLPETNYTSPPVLRKASSLPALTPNSHRQIIEASPNAPPVWHTVLQIIDTKRKSPRDSTETSDAKTTSQQVQDEDILTEEWHGYNVTQTSESGWRYCGPRLSTGIKRYASAYKFTGICVLVTVLIIATSLSLALSLAMQDIKTSNIFNQNPMSEEHIEIDMSVISVDPIAGAMVLEWYPKPRPNGSYHLYFDPNLSATPNPNEADPDNKAVASNVLGQKATFSLSSQISNRTSEFPSFRTVSKLIALGDGGPPFHPDASLHSSLQAYPFDSYDALIFILALTGVEGFNDPPETIAKAAEVPIRLGKTWGLAVGFQVQVQPSRNFDAQGKGLGFALTISRSLALRLFVVLLVLTNWLLTIVFIWVTVTCIFWGEKVVKEIFVVPISVLFAFTAVRSSLPGAPAGFGAFIDFAGILPNITAVAVCSCILLILVTFRRIKEHNKDEKDDDDMENVAPQAIYCSYVQIHKQRPEISENLPV